MYERRTMPLLPRRKFYVRVARHAGLAAVILAVSLAVGMVGYHTLAGLGWMDAFLNASMILGGMGPVAELRSDAAKLFAGLYAIYSGVILLAAVGVIIAPIAHRVLHRLHLDK
jgi:hypothetical protein